jgi:CheY-like chemotaxis protein
MPRIEGQTILDWLRHDERTADTPLLILDSIPTFGSELLTRHPGLSRLTKPCEPSRLLQEVERLLEAPVPIAR